MNPNRCQTGPACNSPTPIEGGKPLRNVKDEFGRRGEEWGRVGKARCQALRPRTWVYNNTPVIGGLLASKHSPFSPSLILNSYAHLRPLRMSGAQVFSNAHDIAVSGGTLCAADTVSETVRYLPNLEADCVDLWQMHININNDVRTTSDRVIFLMPSNPSSRFTGRTEIITNLKRHFSNTSDSCQKRKFFLLYGMGGIGKTQICLKFVEEMSDRRAPIKHQPDPVQIKLNCPQLLSSFLD